MKKIIKTITTWLDAHKTVTALVVAILFALGQIPALVNHEISLEESSTWLLAGGKATMNINSYDYNHHEPQTILWQWLLTPFARLGLPVVTMHIISLLLVSLAVFLLFRFVRANLLLKFILLLSAVFTYYNPVVSRCYSLIPLALVLLVVLFKDRYKKPFRYSLALAFLLQTHFLMSGVVIALVLEYIVGTIMTFLRKGKNRPKLLAIIDFLLPLIASVVLIVLCISNSYAITITGAETSNVYSVKDTTYLFSEKFNLALFGVEWPAIIILLIPLALYLFVACAPALLGLVISLCVAFPLLYTVYNGEFYLGQKAAAILAIAMFWALLSLHLNLLARENTLEDKTKAIKSKESKKSKTSHLLRLPHFPHLPRPLTATLTFVACALPFAFTIPRTIQSVDEDIKYAFSYSTKLENFLSTRLPKNSAVIVAYHEARHLVLPLIAMGNDNIYNAIRETHDDLFSVAETYESQPRGHIFSIATASDVRLLIIELQKKYDHVYFVSTADALTSGSCGSAGKKVLLDDYTDNLTTDSKPSFTFIPQGLHDYWSNAMEFEFYEAVIDPSLTDSKDD